MTLSDATITAAVEGPLHALLSLLLFSSSQSALDASAEYRLLAEYGYYVDAYPRAVAYALTRVDSEEGRTPLVRNLWEEHGEGDTSAGHRHLMTKWLESVATAAELPAMQPFEPLTSTVAARQLLESAYSKDAPFQYGVILGLEFTNTAQLGALLPRLALTRGHDAVDRRFIDVHIEGDDGHADDLLHGARFVLATDTAEFALLEGVRTSLQADTMFWEGINEMLLSQT